MWYKVINCPICDKELREDSEEHYWHLKIHQILNDLKKLEKQHKIS
jgi:organic radical activating enzyme